MMLILLQITLAPLAIAMSSNCQLVNMACSASIKQSCDEAKAKFPDCGNGSAAAAQAAQTPPPSVASVADGAQPLMVADAAANNEAVVQKKVLVAKLGDIGKAAQSDERKSIADAQSRARELNAKLPILPPDQVVAVAKDTDLTNRLALNFFQNHKGPTADDAAQAVDPTIFDDLMKASNAEKVQREIKRQQDLDLADIAKLMAAAGTLTQRAASMGSLADNGSTISVPGESNRSPASANPAKVDGSAGGVSFSDGAHASSSADSTKTADGKNGSGKNGADKTADGKASLHDRLKKSLDQQANKEADSASFGGKLTDLAQAQAQGKAASTGTDSTATRALKDLLGMGQKAGVEGNEKGGEKSLGGSGFDTSGTLGGGGFHLAGADTESAVRKLTAEAEGALPGSFAGSDHSILALDSVSLFERVHNAHKNSLKQGRVRGK
jgi:hypothetical protein